MKTVLLLRTISFYLISLVLVYLVVFPGCKGKITEAEDPLPVKPVVKITNVNYNSNTFSQSFPDTVSLKSVGGAYAWDNYSEEKRIAINSYMKHQVEILGEDAKTFDKILTTMGCNTSEGYILPTYAERANYNGTKAWIVQVALGLGYPSFNHFKCIVFGAEKLDTLNWMACK